MGLFMPNPAVIIFFVLSGYVLGESLTRDGNIIAFLVRRMFRILPPFVFSLLFAFACLTLVHPDVLPQTTSGFFQSQFAPPATLAKLWDNLLFNSTWINGPTWSIYPELVGSLWLPVLVFGHCVAPRSYRWLVFLGTLALILLTTQRIALYFYIGFFLSAEICHIVSRRPSWALISAIAGFSILWLYGGQPFSYEPRYVIPNSIGASLLIGAIASSRTFSAWLEVRPLRFLGRISYSFYLLHWPLFYVTAIFVSLHPAIFSTGFTANLETAAISITLCLIVASASYRFVEMPCIALGKRLSAFASTEPAPALK